VGQAWEVPPRSHIRSFGLGVIGCGPGCHKPDSLVLDNGRSYRAPSPTVRLSILGFSRGPILGFKNGHSLQKIQREDIVQCHKP